MENLCTLNQIKEWADLLLNKVWKPLVVNRRVFKSFRIFSIFLLRFLLSLYIVTPSVTNCLLTDEWKDLLELLFAS